MKDLDSILGQTQAITQLKTALETKLISHAYLFLGPQGVGKQLAAFSFAAALNCQKPGENHTKHCGTCQKIKHGNYPDLHLVEPQGQSLKLDQMRDMQTRIAYKKLESKYQVVIILEAQKMTREAANSLLKVLEEPPPSTVFILVADTSGSILPTILSRCQLIRFKALSSKEIQLILQKEYALTGEDAGEISLLSGGSMSQALEIWESWGSDLTCRSSAKIIGMLFAGDLCQLIRLSSELAKDPYLPVILASLTTWFRDAIVWIRTGSATLLTVPTMDTTQFMPLADKVKVGEQAIILLNQGLKNLKQNANARLTIDVLFLKLYFLIHQKA